MAKFRRRAGNQDEVAALRAEVANMASRLAAADAAAEARAERVEKARLGLAQFATPQAVPAPATSPLPADPPPPIAHAADLDELRTALTQQVAKLADRLDAIDARVTAISTELAAQLTELGVETDATGELAVALQNAQARLTNEQARYQIAFREDLAELAGEIRKKPPPRR